jgi:hypothetical protein
MIKDGVESGTISRTLGETSVQKDLEELWSSLGNVQAKFSEKEIQ